MPGLYDVEVRHDGGDWFTDMVTGSRRLAVARARHIAGAYPWQRKAYVRVVNGFTVVDFNREP